MSHLSISEKRALQRELAAQQKVEHADRRRLAAINRALNYPMPVSKRRARAAERAFAYPVR